MFSLHCLHKTWWSRDISIVSIIDTCGSPELSWAQSQVNIKHFFSCFGHSSHLGLARVIAELCHYPGWNLNTAAESLNIPAEAEDGEHEHREEHPAQLLHVLRPDLPARLAVHEVQPQRPVLSLLPPLQDRLLVPHRHRLPRLRGLLPLLQCEGLAAVKVDQLTIHTAEFADFLSATVVTTVDTMTAPLDDVFFPSVVVCNINQVAVNSQHSLFTKPKLYLQKYFSRNALELQWND